MQVSAPPVQSTAKGAKTICFLCEFCVLRGWSCIREKDCTVGEDHPKSARFAYSHRAPLDATLFLCQQDFQVGCNIIG